MSQKFCPCFVVFGCGSWVCMYFFLDSRKIVKEDVVIPKEKKNSAKNRDSNGSYWALARSMKNSRSLGLETNSFDLASIIQWPGFLETTNPFSSYSQRASVVDSIVIFASHQHLHKSRRSITSLTNALSSSTMRVPSFNCSVAALWCWYIFAVPMIFRPMLSDYV